MFLSCQFLNIINLFAFFLRAECKCHTCISCSSRTPDSMYICLRNIRKIIIDNQRQLININSPGSDICGNHHSRFTRLEVTQCGLPRRLTLISMNSLAANAGFTQLFQLLLFKHLSLGLTP